MADLGAHPAPLLPVAHADTSPQPRIDFRYGPVVIRDAEVVHPASNVTREPLKPIAHRDAPAPSGESPNVMLEVGEGLVGPSQFCSSKGKPQELTVIGLGKGVAVIYFGASG